VNALPVAQAAATESSAGCRASGRGTLLFQGPPLTTALIVGLSAAVVYFGKKWLDARTEVAELKVAIVTLKRRLKLR